MKIKYIICQQLYQWIKHSYIFSCPYSLVWKNLFGLYLCETPTQWFRFSRVAIQDAVLIWLQHTQVLYYLVFRLHINLMQLFVCKNTGTVKHSGTKFDFTPIICNSNTSIYCADLSSTWSTTQKAKIITLYKCVSYRQKTFP